MKNILSTQLVSIFTLFTLSLTAQLSIQTTTESDIDDPCFPEVNLQLNEEVDLIKDDCEFNTEFSNVKEGTNSLFISSEIQTNLGIDIFDIIQLYQIVSLDEEFDSYAQAVAADIDSDAVISTDDLILIARFVTNLDEEIEHAVKIGSLDMLTEPMTGLELRSDHTTYNFDKGDVQDGIDKDVLTILVGDLSAF